MKKGIKTLAMWLIIGVITIVLVSSVLENSSSKMTYSELVTSIENGDVESIKIASRRTTSRTYYRGSNARIKLKNAKYNRFIGYILHLIIPFLQIQFA